MDTKKLEYKIDLLNSTFEKLILIELCKSKISRNRAREILGSLDNNMFSKINKLFNK